MTGQEDATAPARVRLTDGHTEGVLYGPSVEAIAAIVRPEAVVALPGLETLPPGPPRYAAAVCPTPDPETGTREGWARYHLARAWAWIGAMDDLDEAGLESTEYLDRLTYAVMGLLADARAGLLVLWADGTDHQARRVSMTLHDNEVLREAVVRELARLGIDAAAIRAFGTRRVIQNPHLTDPRD